MPEKHSAEFCRGAMQGAREADAPWLEAKYHALLAEAEAREAGVKVALRDARQIAVRATEATEAGLKADREREAGILSKNTEPRPHDWFHSGLSAHPCCRVCGIVQRRDGKNSPCKGPTAISTREATQPTAAEVIKD